MNTKALRQKVLDLAIHGKLVPQNPNDESATVLLEKIRAEKAEKIKKGELKADKKDSFIFVGSDKRHYEQFADGTIKDIEDEIPFEVPEGWAWCRLTNVAITELGKTLDAKKNKGESYDYLCALNVKWYTFDFTTLKQIRLEEKEKERYLVRKGDLLICEGGDVGRSAIWESDNPIYYQNALHRVRFYQNINQYFFLHVLNYYKNIGLIDDVSGGVTIKHFTQNSMQKLLFPLPPLAEQKRIVSVIKTIFFQVEILEQNKTDLQTAIKQAKSKILDLAIHGKLVPQDSNDETAKELLKRIATSDNRPYKKFEEEEPFEIPSNWSWCFLGDICSKIKRGKSPKYVDKSTIMAFAQKCNQKDGPTSLDKALYIDETTLKKYPEEEKMQFNDIVINSTGTGTLGRVGIFNCSIPNDVNAVYPDSHVTTVRILPEIDKLYCYYFIKNKQSYLETIGEGSTNQKELKPDTISSLCFPLPPYPEQKRIVFKIEELFSSLETIVSNLD